MKYLNREQLFSKLENIASNSGVSSDIWLTNIINDLRTDNSIDSWIAINSNNLPTSDNKVFVYSESTGVIPAVYRLDIKQFLADNIVISGVTHWMPYPDAPI